MKALIEQNGNVSRVVEYLGRQGGHWVAVPGTPGNITLPPCARIDLFKKYVGLDPTEMYPAVAPAQSGDSIDKVIGWAASEVEGFMRA